nr:hypothetical protein [Chryseobacterium sp. MEBOG07]
MKRLVVLMTLLIFGISYAQSTPKFENDTLTTSTGFKVYEGLDLKIGTGSMNDGDFKFIRTNASSLFNYSSTTGYQGLANQANSFKRSNSGLTFKVKKIMPRGSKKNGFVYYCKIGSGLVNYEIDLENAIRSGELIIPDEFLPKEKSQHLNSETKYDKLKKLKNCKIQESYPKKNFKRRKIK